MSSYVVGPGDSVYGIAQHLPGVDGGTDIPEVAYHITQLPENAEVLEDGLQPGEVLTVPESIE